MALYLLQAVFIILTDSYIFTTVQNEACFVLMLSIPYVSTSIQ